MQSNTFFRDNKYLILSVSGFIVLIVLATFFLHSYIGAINVQNEIQREKIRAEQAALEAEMNHQKDLEAAAANQRAQDIKDREAAELKKITEDAKLAKQRKIDLDLCLSKAQASYSVNWDNSCKTVSKQQYQKYLTCKTLMADYYSPEGLVTYCLSIAPYVKEEGCSLPQEIAKRWDDELALDKNRCYSLFK